MNACPAAARSTLRPFCCRFDKLCGVAVDGSAAAAAVRWELFRPGFDNDQIGFAVDPTIAGLNHLAARERLMEFADDDGIVRNWLG